MVNVLWRHLISAIFDGFISKCECSRTGYKFRLLFWRVKCANQASDFTSLSCFRRPQLFIVDGDPNANEGIGVTCANQVHPVVCMPATVWTCSTQNTNGVHQAHSERRTMQRVGISFWWPTCWVLHLSTVFVHGTGTGQRCAKKSKLRPLPAMGCNHS